MILVIIASIIEGNILSPRLLAFAEIFGLWGALFAAPVAGFGQAIATAFWRNWRSAHPEQYPEDVEAQPQGQGILAPSNGAVELPAPALTQEVSVPPAIDPSA